jgi:hypothetical protein
MSSLFWARLGGQRPPNLTPTGLSRQEAYAAQDASTKGRIVQGTHHPRDGTTETFRTNTSVQEVYQVIISRHLPAAFNLACEI